MMHRGRGPFLIVALGYALCTACGASAHADASAEQEAIRLLERAHAREERLGGVQGVLEAQITANGEGEKPSTVHFWLDSGADFLVWNEFSQTDLRGGTVSTVEQGEFEVLFQSRLLDAPSEYAWDWAEGVWVHIEPILRPLASQPGIRGVEELIRSYRFDHVEKDKQTIILHGQERAPEAGCEPLQIRITLLADKEYALSRVVISGADYEWNAAWQEYTRVGENAWVPKVYESTLKSASEGSGWTWEVTTETRILELAEAAERPNLPAPGLPVYDLRRWGRTRVLNLLEPLEEPFEALDRFRRRPEGTTLLQVACATPVAGPLVLLGAMAMLGWRLAYRPSKRGDIAGRRPSADKPCA